MENKTYIGKKGYTIYKNDFNQTQLYEIRTSLTMKPNASMPGLNSQVSYPIYRESTSKMYLPRYYGIDIFGTPSNNILSNGEDINCKF